MNVGLRLIVPCELMDNAIALTYACGAQGIQWVDADDGGPSPGTVWVHVWHEERTIDAQIRRYCESLGPRHIERIEAVNEELNLDAPREFSLTDGYSVHCIHDHSSPLLPTDLHHQDQKVIDWSGVPDSVGRSPDDAHFSSGAGLCSRSPRNTKSSRYRDGHRHIGILAALKGGTCVGHGYRRHRAPAAARNAIRNGVQAHFQIGEALPEDTQFNLTQTCIWVRS